MLACLPYKTKIILTRHMAEISMAEASYFAPGGAVLTNFEGVTKAFAKVVVGAE